MKFTLSNRISRRGFLGTLGGGSAIASLFSFGIPSFLKSESRLESCTAPDAIADIGINPFPFNYSDAFIKSEFNLFACRCADIFSSGTSRTMNSLVILGDVGMGKTRLLKEIGKKIRSKHPGQRVRYVTAQSFTDEMINAFRNNSISHFKKKYREDTDWLLFDDLEQLSGREKSQEQLMHILISLQGNGGRVAYGTSVPPLKLQNFVSPFHSRLSSYVVAHINNPKRRERLQLLLAYCKNENISLDYSELEKIAARESNDIRNLFGEVRRRTLDRALNGKPQTNIS